MRVLRHENDYKEDFLREHEYILSYPFFAYKKVEKIIPNLTHAKINMWESRGLISSSRDKQDTGWRKFSISDMIPLSIVSYLRKVDFSIEKTKQTIDKLTSGQIKINDAKKGIYSSDFITLNNAFIVCLFNIRLFLVINIEHKPYFCFEISAETLFPKLKTKANPLIILPFHSYVSYIVNILRETLDLNKDSKPEQILDNILPYEERRIARWISNSNYKVIKFKKKSNSKEIIVKPDPKIKRHFLKGIIGAVQKGEYHSLSITTKRGQRIIIPREEWVKRRGANSKS